MNRNVRRIVCNAVVSLEFQRNDKDPYNVGVLLYSVFAIGVYGRSK